MSAPSSAQPFSARTAVRGLVRPAVRLTREIPPRLRLINQTGRGPLAVFLPAYGPEGAALLRIYAVARALRPLGWRTLVLPWKLTLHQRHRLLAAAAPSLLVMQGARHELNRPALYPGYPIVFDMDDADFHLPHLSAPVRRAMPDVAAVIAGSVYVADWCRAAGAREAHVVWTGAPVSPGRTPPQAGRPPVLVWGQTRPMTYTREAAVVRDLVRRLGAVRPGVTLRLFDRKPGDDPSFADTFKAPGVTVEWRETLRFSDYTAAFRDAAIGLAPLCPETPFSRGKSFGKVLTYLDAGVPVIASDACEHGRFFTQGTGVVSNDPDIWLGETLRLLEDASARQAMAEAARAAFKTRLSLETAARLTDRILRNVT